MRVEDIIYSGCSSIYISRLWGYELVSSIRDCAWVLLLLRVPYSFRVLNRDPKLESYPYQKSQARARTAMASTWRFMGSYTWGYKGSFKGSTAFRV